ncbi:MAG: hypothetical protein QM572_13965 [Nocardioides sp.]|uniref:hypothetical protein n=1 Tax=Nocardioides sp. TaxID=35761 RepID=UPI0039E4A748
MMLTRRAPVLAVVLALCAALFAAAPATAKKGSCGRASGCTKFELIHAGSTYAWYPAAVRNEFKSREGAHSLDGWSKTGNGQWLGGAQANGQQGIISDYDGGDVYTDMSRSWVNGRWEVRFRSLSQRDPGQTTQAIRESDGKLHDYPVQDAGIRIELVPAGTETQRCSPTSVLLSGYHPTDGKSTAIGVNAPDATYAGTETAWSQFGDLSYHRHWTGPTESKKSAWHVVGVQLTSTTITWFLDGKVTYRAPRPASTRNTAFHLRQSVLGGDPANGHTVTTRAMMDWARYWTLKRTTKNKKKLRALANAPLLAGSSSTTVGPC